jgi:D-lactate dehydrogenase
VAASEIGYTYVSLDELLRRSDYITLHAPSTPENYHLLGAEQFAKVKHGAYIVNTGRGTLIDTPELIRALEGGRVAGVGLDVLEGEEFIDEANELELFEDEHIDDRARQALGIDILSKMPNVLITSHNAFNSAEALERIHATTISNIQAHLANKPENLVILPHA